jgi:hypothetical protein
MKTFSKKLFTLQLLIPVGLMLLSVVYLIGCFELNFGTFSLPEEGFVPVIAGILIFSTSCCLVIDVFRLVKKLPVPFADTEKEMVQISDLFVFIGILFGYLILLAFMGFIFSTFLALIASTRMMGTKWRSAFLVAVGVTVVTYVIFIFWLNIPFPQPFFM